ncbi:acylneuraminate cytidylyltransferase family protein [Desulfotruncus alcoholivorax]|uniref:acylneuraminate cytidylyltransferase family protein n=1 Tax=Desulfotruncus alcoholivorax TaxID=265477 RepID=UPI0004207962|nr:acylneuraminate cytidylyltransferase family protein [Desulfotruncus alcoholivorax]
MPFVRPAGLAQDDTPGIEPVLHALQILPKRYDHVVLLQPTSPLRLVEDIDGCIDMCIERGSPACVSVTEPADNPYWMYRLSPEGFLRPLFVQDEIPDRRQELPPVYALNGAVYVARCGWLLEKRTFLSDETTAFIMPPEHSLDVYTEIDLQLCECMLKQLSVR